MDKFTFTYYVNDGYYPGNRPVEFNLSTDDIAFDVLDVGTDEEIAKLYDEYIHEHFENNVFPDGGNLNKFIDFVKSLQESK